MSEHLIEPALHPARQAEARRRHQHGGDASLILSELDPDAVVDHLDPPEEPVDLITCGMVRETCPRCGAHHLKLVLRQRRVRIEHLLCSECLACFDARYANGSPALTI